MIPLFVFGCELGFLLASKRWDQPDVVVFGYCGGLIVPKVLLLRFVEETHLLETQLGMVLFLCEQCVRVLANLMTSLPRQLQSWFIFFISGDFGLKGRCIFLLFPFLVFLEALQG